MGDHNTRSIDTISEELHRASMEYIKTRQTYERNGVGAGALIGIIAGGVLGSFSGTREAIQGAALGGPVGALGGLYLGEILCYYCSEIGARRHRLYEEFERRLSSR